MHPYLGSLGTRLPYDKPWLCQLEKEGWEGRWLHLRDDLPPGDVQLIVVGKLELVEPDANHGTDLHVQGLLLGKDKGHTHGG